jgi:hypothetical protein
MTATNKRLLISKSHDDSNRCTPCRGKPDQYATHFPRSVCVWSKTIRISCGPHITTHHERPTYLNGSHCSWEKGLPTQSTTHRLTDSRVHTQFLSWANQWSSRHKPISYQWPTTRLTGPINTNMRSVRSILARGGQPIVLNRRRQGLQPWRCQLFTYHSPTIPTGGLHFPTRRPARSLV